MFNILKKVLGTKYDRDVKKYMPIVDEINANFESYKSLSHDELRNKTLEFRARIKEHLAGIDTDIENAKKEASEETDLFKKEDIFKEIDALTKERDKHLEEILEAILPEAFAVVKETSRRFKDNETIEVSATDFDRDIAASNTWSQEPFLRY